MIGQTGGLTVQDIIGERVQFFHHKVSGTGLLSSDLLLLDQFYITDDPTALFMAFKTKDVEYVHEWDDYAQGGRVSQFAVSIL